VLSRENATISGVQHQMKYLLAGPALLALLAACGTDRNSTPESADSSTPVSAPSSAAAAAEPVGERATGFAIDLWPGEGIPVIQARRAILLLQATTDPNSAVVDSLVGDVGARIPFDSTRYVTLEPGLIRVTSPLQLTGRNLGAVQHLSRERYHSKEPPQIADSMAPPATIVYLQDRAEGTCFVRVGQRVIDADPCPALGQGNVRVERRPITSWWIGVRGQGGRFGWVVVSDTTAQSVQREF
jgi:hypothetical protein